MKKIKVYTVDAFTKQPFKGNPAAVVISDDLNETIMQEIAKEINLSETAFVMKSKNTDFKVRYFTPTKEINFCGHATIALAWVLKEKERFLKDAFSIETNIGIIPLTYEYKEGKLDKVVMRQVKAELRDFPMELEYLSNMIGVNSKLINLEKVKIAYTGNWHMLVMVNSKEAIDNATPDFKKLEFHNKASNIATTHLFTFDTKGQYLVYTRDFAPAAGINEDPVTGSANGALAAFLKIDHLIDQDEYIILQGNSKNRLGELYISTEETTEGVFVKVKGQAVIIFEGLLNL